MIVIIFILIVWGYFIYRKIKKDKLKAKSENIKAIELAIAKKEIERLKSLQEKNIDIEIDNTIKYIPNHIQNEKYQNRNELIGVSINRITVSSNKFTVFINIYNISNTSLNIKIKDCFYVSASKEQIKSDYNDKLLSNIIDNDILISGLNVIRELDFFTHKKTFDFEDVLIVNFEVNGYDFFLTESFDMIHNVYVASV